MTAPLRFVGLVIGGWTAARALVLMWPAEPPEPPANPMPLAWGPANESAARARPVRPVLGSAELRSFLRPPERVATLLAPAPVGSRDPRPIIMHLASARVAIPATETPPRMQVAAALPASPALVALQPRMAAPVPLPLGLNDGLPASRAPASRLSGSAWMLARGGGEGALAAGEGLLGGSQAGVRLLYRVNGDAARPISLAARISSPLRRRGGEAAVGVEWQPSAGLPLRLLAERRQRMTGEGRSTFALLVHGGVSELPVAAGFRLDAYAQGGVVGARRRDLFVDGGATLMRPLGGQDGLFAAGLGAWGGVQPGASRFDIGPRVTARITAGEQSARVSLDWRFRVVGKAAPASGPSLTLTTGF